MNVIHYTISGLILLCLRASPTLAQSTYEPYTFITLAGGGGFNSLDMPGTAARFNIPDGVAADRAGNLYVADIFHHAIRKVAPDGRATTLAGLPGILGSADGTGNDARFAYPAKVALDSAGNVYVSDGNHTIRKVTPEGVVTTLAGLAGHPGSVNGTNSNARFDSPDGLALDSAGNVYVAEPGNTTIRKVTPVGTNWVVTTIAGLAGGRGSADGTNSVARFNFPQGLAIDSAGNLYVADTDNYTIRKVTPVGTNWVVTTLAGRAGSLGSVDGTNSAARFNGPVGLAVDAAANIYVTDYNNHTIRKVTLMGTNWVVTTLAGLAGHSGSVDGPGSEARFDLPYGLAIDVAGNAYVSENGNDTIRKLTAIGTNWMVTTLAGLGGNHGSAEGSGREARFSGPSSMAVDNAGSVYVADRLNHTIRKVTSAGEVTTLAGLAGYAGSQNGTGSVAQFNNPRGIAVDNSGNVYVADTLNHTIRKITPVGLDWAVTTIAGFPDPLENGGCADGSGSTARLSFPHGLAVDGAGNVYAADTFNNMIRKVTPAGMVTTRAGSCGESGSADGMGATARFNSPYGVAVDSATNIYVADTYNHTIRKVTPAKVVTTIAGQAGNPGSTDGIGSAARFYFPSDVAVDGVGDVYVADAYNNTIRKITPVGTNWVVTTLGGMAGFYGTADGTGSVARFCNPNGVAVDSAGNIYVADYYFNTIRKGYAPPKILNLGFMASEFRFDLTGPLGQSVVVEVSTNLVNWLPVWTNASTGALNFSDPSSAGSSYRFYRAYAQ